MALRNRHYRKSPSTPEVQTAFFDRTPTAPAFFNPTHSTATSTIQRQEGSLAPPKSEEEKPVQKMTKEEEKPVQKQAAPTEEKPKQSRVTTHPSNQEETQEQTASLPDRLKMGIEALSGISMEDVKVHYNSLKPRQIGALAYTQGTDIYLAPGQEQHLSHEAWHVVQQKQGRVAPTMQAKGLGVNDDRGLEQEATAMGHKAASVT